MKCDKCNDEVHIIITNLRKNDTINLCSIHFLEFNVQMFSFYKKFGSAVKEIDRILGEMK